MDSAYLLTPLTFLVEVLFGFYAILLLLRFLLQQVHADFHNPLSLTIVKLTAPVLMPLRRFIPRYKKSDLSALIAAWGIYALQNLILLALIQYPGAWLAALPWAVPKLIGSIFTIFIFAIIVNAVLSWFANANTNYLQQITSSLSYPILWRIKRLLPLSSGAIDFSPMLAILALIVLKMLIMSPLYALFGVPLFLRT
jgi:YggT family protein